MVRVARNGVEIGRTWVRPLHRRGRLGLALLWKALALLLDEEDGFFFGCPCRALRRRFWSGSGPLGTFARTPAADTFGRPWRRNPGSLAVRVHGKGGLTLP